jgi:chromosome segregation ATPase
MEEFESKLTKLNEVRNKVGPNLEFKSKFTESVKNGLNDIKSRVIQLTSLISGLKKTSDDLQQKINSNSSAIGDKDNQIQQLTQQINALNQQKQTADQEANVQKQATQEQINNLQQKINQTEEQLRESQTKLQEQQTTIQKINEYEQKIQNLEQQLREKEQQTQQNIQQINEQLENSKTQITQLQSQIEPLQKENQQLTQRLIKATESIQQATEDLERVLTSVPNEDSKQEFDNLINDIRNEIDKTLQNISSATQGRDTYNLEENYNNLLSLRKSSDARNYNAFIQSLNNGQLENQINQLIRGVDNGEQNSIQQLKKILSDNKIMVRTNYYGIGGKRHRHSHRRKHRTQTGGFTYKTNSKRKSIKTPQNYSKSKPSRLTRSSRTSKKTSIRNSTKRSSV